MGFPLQLSDDRPSGSDDLLLVGEGRLRVRRREEVKISFAFQAGPGAKSQMFFKRLAEMDEAGLAVLEINTIRAVLQHGLDQRTAFGQRLGRVLNLRSPLGNAPFQGAEAVAQRLLGPMAFAHFPDQVLNHKCRDGDCEQGGQDEQPPSRPARRLIVTVRCHHRLIHAPPLIVHKGIPGLVVGQQIGQHHVRHHLPPQFRLVLLPGKVERALVTFHIRHPVAPDGGYKLPFLHRFEPGFDLVEERRNFSRVRGPLCQHPVNLAGVGKQEHLRRQTAVQSRIPQGFARQLCFLPPAVHNFLELGIQMRHLNLSQPADAEQDDNQQSEGNPQRQGGAFDLHGSPSGAPGQKPARTSTAGSRPKWVTGRLEAAAPPRTIPGGFASGSALRPTRLKRSNAKLESSHSRAVPRR